jgi:hypothetical protein
VVGTTPLTVLTQNKRFASVPPCLLLKEKREVGVTVFVHTGWCPGDK